MSTSSDDLLFEIGTEELPGTEINHALAALAEYIENALAQARLGHGRIETYATPRRLAVIVRALEDRATDMESVVMGPSARIAFDDDGNPTRAAIGFAKGKGLDPASLERVETPKGEYVAATVHEKGGLTRDIVPDILNGAFGAIHWKRAMHWGWSTVSFARPVRWVVALYGDGVLPVQFGNVNAGNTTRGHRFLAPDPIELNSADGYLPALRGAYVMASVEERRDTIRQDVHDVAHKAGLRALIDDDLLEEVIHLVEWPTTHIGRFDTDLLEVPREVLIVSMRTHQRYFPAENADGKLANAFIFVSNMVTARPEVIIDGNLRVLRARLEDARFFWREDRQVTLEDRREQLRAIRYIDGIGNLHDRSSRLETLASSMVDDYADGDTDLRKQTARAGRLSKCDLASAMVREFPELQGVMGRYYAAADGEDETVSRAIDEHYMPRGADGELPTTQAGAFVAIADKIDAITGCFALGLTPSGSADPYALRRAAIGLLRIAIAHRLPLRISSLAGRAYDLHPQEKLLARQDVVRDVDAFIRTRLHALLPNTPTDVAQAVIVAIGDDLPSLPSRASVLIDLQDDPNFDALAMGFKRVVNIVAKAESSQDEFAQKLQKGHAVAGEQYLKENEEIALWNALTSAQKDVQKAHDRDDFHAMARTLIGLKGPIDAFFDAVLVNDEDPGIRENRLALLATVRALFLRFADISLIQARNSDA